MKKTILTDLVLVLACLAASSCSSEQVQIRARKEHTVRSALSPDVEPSTTLLVGANEIHNVVGHAPYYLNIPEWNSIFVATETADHHFRYHIVSLTDQSDKIIDGNSTSFGYWIGRTGAVSREFVAKVEEHRVTIARESDSRRTSYTLDLQRRRPISMEIEELDSKGKTIRRTINDLK